MLSSDTVIATLSSLVSIVLFDIPLSVFLLIWVWWVVLEIKGIYQ